ncbi:DUF4145 domain-containing protein [Candidatus Poribacteria bacterium]|nr:DUF4145 domain-containing protein [Candidatus Poribacteria bacterium]
MCVDCTRLSNSDEFVLQTLFLLDLGNYRARQKDERKDQRIQFFTIKDEVMRLIHEAFTNTGSLRYSRVPFLRRCLACKRKADLLHKEDTQKSWEYHLNMLPQCPDDTDVPEKAAIELLLLYKGERFSFHIPESKTILWSLSPEEMIEKKWVPEVDFDRSDRWKIDTRPLKDIVTKLKLYMNVFQEALANIQQVQIGELQTSGDKRVDANIANQLQRIKKKLDSLSKQLGQLNTQFFMALRVAQIDPSLAIAKSRYIVERVLRQAYQRETGDSAGRQMIEQLSQKLRSQGVLPSIVHAHVSFVQNIGNVCIHPQDPDGMLDPTMEDVEQAIYAAIRVTEWYFEKYNEGID